MPACRAGPGGLTPRYARLNQRRGRHAAFACPAPSGYRLEEYEEAYQVLREGASPRAKVILDMSTL
jgi:hypothetical protein